MPTKIFKDNNFNVTTLGEKDQNSCLNFSFNQNNGANIKKSKSSYGFTNSDDNFSVNVVPSQNIPCL